MYRVLVYLGETAYNDETVQTIEYSFHDLQKMLVYINMANNKMHEKDLYFSYIVEEIKIEKDIEKEENDLT